jgi:hypothetical protein
VSNPVSRTGAASHKRSYVAPKAAQGRWCMIVLVQVLVDADNLDVPRLRLLVAALDPGPCAEIVVAGAPAVLEAIDWPPHAQVLPASGWQGADLLLARAYRADDQPLLLATGDGDFAQLARRHPGPVLLVSGTASRSRTLAGPRITPTDPAADGGAALRSWIASWGQTAGR